MTYRIMFRHRERSLLLSDSKDPLNASQGGFHGRDRLTCACKGETLGLDGG